jgi:gamma-glutamylcyclotransferase (GGCT)/AIG2-like uncharacterized protein YtfP
LFVYGTLMVPEVMRTVSGRSVVGEGARLPGYRCRRLHGEVYPGIVPAAGESVDGLLYRGLDAAAMARLDDFEGEMYRRETVRVALSAGRRVDAEAFVIIEAFIECLGPEPWSLDDFLRDGLQHFAGEYLGFARVQDPPADEPS